MNRLIIINETTIINCDNIVAIKKESETGEAAEKVLISLANTDHIELAFKSGGRDKVDRMYEGIKDFLIYSCDDVLNITTN